MAYFLPGVRFRHALVEAVARGVRVTLLLQDASVLLHHASARCGSLLDAGIEIQEYHKSFLHAKVAVIDGYWATVGSSNIDPFSLFMAREANIVVEDKVFALELRANVSALIEQGARRVVRESWSKQPLPARLLAWLSFGIFRLSTGILGYAKEQEGA
jgi:cardiolipin synthase